jgi:hypothetical protein
MTMPFDEIRDSTLAELDQLTREAEIAYSELVLPGWGTKDRHGFPRTLYGYIISAFTFIDLLSLYHSKQRSPQNPRMVKFMTDYLGYDLRASKAAVQLWRNTLMHTGLPRVLEDRASGTRILWLLHWKEHLPRVQHMKLIPGAASGEEILNTGVMYLLTDLQAGAQKLFVDLAATPSLRSDVENVHSAMLASQEIR